jgi:hypothetical protein
MVRDRIKYIDLPETRIDGDYCIVCEVGSHVIWGAETYTKRRADKLANERLKLTQGQGLMFGVELKSSFPGGEPK